MSPNIISTAERCSYRKYQQRFPSHPTNPSHPLVAPENFCPYIWEMEKHLSIVTLHNQCNKTHLFRIYLRKDKDKDWKWKRPSITIFSKSRRFEDIKYETERGFATKSESQQHQRICGISSQKVGKSNKWGQFLFPGKRPMWGEGKDGGGGALW